MEDISEAENGDEEEMYPNNNVQVREKENHQRCRPKSPIAQNYVKTRGGYIKIKKKIVPDNQAYAETARNVRKIRIIGDSHMGKLSKRHFNGKTNGKIYFNVFHGANIKSLHHIMQPTLHEGKPDKVLIHTGSNDIIPNIPNIPNNLTQMLKMSLK